MYPFDEKTESSNKIVTCIYYVMYFEKSHPLKENKNKCYLKNILKHLGSQDVDDRKKEEHDVTPKYANI